MADKKKKQNNNETPDSYASEGATWGAVIGGFLFIIMAITGHSAYGAVALMISIVIGLLMGMTILKPNRGDMEKEKEIRDYKKLDKERNAFFPDRSKKKYDPMMKTPCIRKNLANGERVAGFMNRAAGRFEEKMLIRDEKDLKEFMRQYGIEEAIEDNKNQE